MRRTTRRLPISSRRRFRVRARLLESTSRSIGLRMMNVVFRPEEFEHFTEGVLLAEPFPPKELEAIYRRFNRILFERPARLALLQEREVAWSHQVFGRGDAVDGECLHLVLSIGFG